MFIFSLSAVTWNDATALTHGMLPSARANHGFTSAADGMLYLVGGIGSQGWENMSLWTSNIILVK